MILKITNIISSLIENNLCDSYGTIIIGIQDNKKIIGIDEELNSQFIKKKIKMDINLG